VKEIWTGCDNEIEQNQELARAKREREVKLKSLARTKSGTRHEEKLDRWVSEEKN
jgi:hypothetical protein